jgi:DNA polymerase III epsilon subunit-like protein
VPVIVLDTETSGHVGVGLSSVIEVGAVCLTSDGHELSTFSTYVRPKWPLGDWAYHAMKVNQIDERLLYNAPPADAAWTALLGWMSLHKPVTQVLAFNVPFDKGMMIKTFPGAEHLPWGPCLMRSASERIKGNRASIKLLDAARHLGVHLQADLGHRALVDARMAGRLWAALVSAPQLQATG